MRALRINRTIVMVSGGKDSVASLAICRDVCKEVAAYFMYVVPGLGFQERYLTYLEAKFDVPIVRLPHWSLSRAMKHGVFRHSTGRTAARTYLHSSDTNAHMRKRTGIRWIASGEKQCDSIPRNAMLRKCRGVDAARWHLFPVAGYSHSGVFSLLKERGVALPPDYRYGRSNMFGSFCFDECDDIKRNFPEDWGKILKQFPMLRLQYDREALRRRKARDEGGDAE